MKSKFILHGGFAQGEKQRDDLFFQEMLKDTPDSVKILLVYFAEPEEKVQLRTEQDQEELNTNRGLKQLTFKVATETSFREDCSWAEVIYLHGGKTIKLMESLNNYQNIAQMFLGKIVAADSAGAHVLGRFFYSKNSKTIGKGLGILPLKIMAHYEGDMPNPLIDVEPGLETLLLHEYEIRVITS